MEESMALGQTVKKKFFAALIAGFLLLGGMAALFGITGTAFALPLGGMGDFYVVFDKLEGKGFELNPNIGETGEQDAAPMIRNQIDSATIQGLHIYKDLKMPTGDWVRINVVASQPTTVQGLIQDARFIDANLGFNNFAIEQTNTSNMGAAEAFTENWSHNAEDVTITNGKIVTSYLFQNLVSLQGAKISLENIDGPDLSGEGTVGMAGGGGKGSGGSGLGGILPKTASNSFILISIGTLLVGIGAIVFFRRRFSTN